LELVNSTRPGHDLGAMFRQQRCRGFANPARRASNSDDFSFDVTHGLSPLAIDPEMIAAS